eukprot:scaffold28393_cov70-Skeletonema_dohrnii-CCMP3373.AAC.2
MSSPSIVAWAFALSPFPAYLPQYFSLIRQTSAENEDDDTRTSLRSHGSENALVEEQHEVIIDRGIDSLRKRNNLHDSPSSTKIKKVTAAPHSAGLLIQGLGSPSKSSNCDVNGSNKSASSGGAGLSRATVFLLLSSHLLRMLYFYGLMVENEKILSGDTSDGAAIQTTATTIQWDLFGQSVCMIVMQLLLLRAMTRMRSLTRRKTGSNTDYPSPSRLFECHQDNDTTQRGGNAWQSMNAITKAHFRRLLSPFNILQHHSFLDYVELIFLSSIATKLMFDYQWYPRYRMRSVDALKHTSIVLESCLALPQAMRNYSNKTTEGLNVIMVGGWILGDFLKLFYFTSQLLWSRVTGVGDAGNIVFVFGCIFALAMDFLVCLQMAVWYPSRETLELKEGLIRSMQKLKASHRSNESLPCKFLRCMKEARSSS